MSYDEPFGAMPPLVIRPDAYGVSLKRPDHEQELRVFYDEIPSIIENLKEAHNARNASRSEKL